MKINIEPKTTIDKKEFIKYFNKISSNKVDAKVSKNTIIITIKKFEK